MATTTELGENELEATGGREVDSKYRLIILAAKRSKQLQRGANPRIDIDPQNLKALALGGSAAFEKQDYARAAELWSRMLPLVPPGSADARSIGENVDEAKKLAAIGGSSAKASRRNILRS